MSCVFNSHTVVNTLELLTILLLNWGGIWDFIDHEAVVFVTHVFNSDEPFMCIRGPFVIGCMKGAVFSYCVVLPANWV